MLKLRLRYEPEGSDQTEPVMSDARALIEQLHTPTLTGLVTDAIG
jgi:hypothetical protein